MASVHFITHHDQENAVARYRCLNFMDQLREKGWTANFSYRFQPEPIAVSEDVVVLNRVLLDDSISGFIERLKGAGKAVVYGLDDLVFSGDWADKERAEQDERSAEAVWKQTMGFMERSKEAMMLCDAALVSTQYLAERSVGIGKEAYVLRNTLPKNLAEISEKVMRHGQGNKVLLGYSSGTRTHNRDFDSIAEVLAKLLARHQNADLMIVGPVQIPRVLASFENRITHHGIVDWRKLPTLLASFDVNLAPLDLSFAFNHGKSHLKWLESAAVKVPTVASQTTELSSSIVEGVDGFTAATPEDWFVILEKVVEAPALRKKMGEAAFEKVSREYTASAQSLQTASVFEAIAAKFSSGVPENVVLEGHEEPSLLTKGIRRLIRAVKGEP